VACNPGERDRSFGYGNHGGSDPGGEVCRRGLGGGVAVATALVFMGRVRRHYELTDEEVALKGGVALSAENMAPPIVLVPVDRWNAATEKALQFALTLSPDVQAVHVTCETDEGRPPWDAAKPAEGIRFRSW